MMPTEDNLLNAVITVLLISIAALVVTKKMSYNHNSSSGAGIHI